MEFHEKLQELRKARGLTQEELAAELYFSRTAISKWESGRGYPSIASLKEISTYFGILKFLMFPTKYTLKNVAAFSLTSLKTDSEWKFTTMYRKLWGRESAVKTQQFYESVKPA